MSHAGAPEVAANPAAARKEQQAQDLARVKEAGWTHPIPFKYESVVGGTPAEDETRNSAVWQSDAAVYQWDDDFGDVGEPNPDLEVRVPTRGATQPAFSSWTPP
jgi:ATP-dependent RNA helicase DDX3X